MKRLMFFLIQESLKLLKHDVKRTPVFVCLLTLPGRRPLSATWCCGGPQFPCSTLPKSSGMPELTRSGALKHELSNNPGKTNTNQKPGLSKDHVSI